MSLVIFGKQHDSFPTDVLYCCYRYNFPEIDYYTDDAGWGCVIRSFQMMIGNALRLHCSEAENLDDLVKDTGTDVPFSIQSIVTSARAYGLIGGDWLTPELGAQCLRDVAKNCSRVDVRICAGSSPSAIIDFKPHLLLLPVQLGIGNIHKTYLPTLYNMLVDKRSMGIVTGQGNSSLFVIGIDNHTRQAIYLDPHDLREAKDPNYGPSKFHRKNLEAFSPSMCIGFYVATKQDELELRKTYDDVFCIISVDDDDKKNWDVQDDEQSGFCMIEDGSL